MYDYFDEAKNLLGDFIKPKSKDQHFYYSRIRDFFDEYMGRENNTDKPIKTITPYDINTYLKGLKKSPNEKLNCYSALKKFFEYTYTIDATFDVMKGVAKPPKQDKDSVYISKEHTKRLIEFTKNNNENLNDRLIIGFFLYTGLSRQYISKLTNSNISTQTVEYTLHIKRGKSYTYVPLKNELVDLIKEYWKDMAIVKPNDTFFNYNENYLSTKVAETTIKVVNKRYTPTHFSNTFIKACIENNYDIYVISPSFVFPIPISCVSGQFL